MEILPNLNWSLYVLELETRSKEIVQTLNLFLKWDGTQVLPTIGMAELKLLSVSN